MEVRFLPGTQKDNYNIIIMASVDEYLDLVDENDNVIGKKLRSEIYAENLSNYRVINVFIVDSKGEILMPRRTASKKIFPLCLDMSVGGHVRSGESYEEALKHETKGEVGINIENVPCCCLGSLTPQKNGVSAFMQVYEIKSDEIPNYNKNDYFAYFWLTPKELLKRIARGEKTKGDLPKLIKY